MPKQVYKLERFDGGANTQSSPKDIGDNEVVSIVNGFVDSVGKVRTAPLSNTILLTTDGGTPNSSSANRMTILDGEVINGDGLFLFSSDWRGGQIKTTGAHTGSDGAAILEDDTNQFVEDILNSAKVYNLTDGSSATISDTYNGSAAGTGDGKLVGGLSGGTDDDWDEDDSYRVYAMSGASSVTEAGDDYLCIPRQQANGGGIYIKSRNGGNSAVAIIEFNSNANILPQYYSVDGVLRVCDSAITTNYQSTNVNKWYGYINRTLFEGFPSAYQHTIDGWITENSEPATPAAGSDLTAGAEITGASGFYTDATDVASTGTNNDTGYTSATDAISTGSGDTLTNKAAGTLQGGTFSGNTVTSAAVHIKVDANNNANWNAQVVVRIGQANSTTQFQTSGYQYKVLDLYNLKGFGGEDPDTRDNLTAEFTFSGTEFDVTSNNARVSLRVLSNSSGVAPTIDYMTFFSGSNGAEAFSSIDNAVSVVVGDSYTASTDWAGEWNVGVSYVYDGKQESLVRPLSVAGVKTVTLTKAPYTNVGFRYTPRWNQRITGINVYMKKESDSDWLLHALCDLKAGEVYRYGDTEKVVGAVSGTTADKKYLFSLGGELSPDLPVANYESYSGIPQDTKSLTARFKTAVVANRRVYIGNVKMQDELGTTRVFADRIIKSPVNRFDTFPIHNSVEAAVNDGESIVELVAFGDRLLQFKERTLYVLNIAGKYEALESTHQFRGVAHKGAVAKMEIGVAWVNKHGCFFFDGNTIKNLLEKRGLRAISESTWTAFITDESSVSYIPSTRQLVVVSSYAAGANTGDAYIFDFVTHSWVKTTDFTSSTYSISNITHLWDGSLVWIENEATNVFLKRKDLSAPTATITATTIAFVDSNPDTITDSGDGFLTAGFEAGMKIVVTGAGESGNNATFTIASVVAGTITLGGSDALTAESASASITIQSGTPNFELITKEVDFGNPASKKNIYKVVATYKGGSAQLITPTYGVDGATPSSAFNAGVLSVTANSNQNVLEITPSSTIKNVKSFQLKLAGVAANTFELNDLNIVYREKRVV
jgi:hypothetical protein